MSKPANVVGLFLASAEVVATAISDPAVAAAWDQPSVLEEQTVGSLAGHLSRGGVWVVGTYLEAGLPTAPLSFDRAATYFDGLMSAATPEDHQAIRDRAAAAGSGGPDSVAATLRMRLDRLRIRLVETDPRTRVQVAGGSVMHLDDYLMTRIVEQVVHLDDMARSIDRPLASLPPAAHAVAISVGVDLAQLRSGTTSVVRSLYRAGFADRVLPVL